MKPPSPPPEPLADSDSQPAEVQVQPSGSETPPAVSPKRDTSTSSRASRIALILRVILGIGVLILAGGITARLVATKPVAEANPDPDANLPRVVTFASSPVSVPRQWRGYGTAQAVISADVPARVTATVERIPAGIDPGEWVQANAILAELDTTDFTNAATAARNALLALNARIAQLAAEEQRLTSRLEIEVQDLEAARRDAERIRRLAERRAASEQDLTRTERDVLAARRTLNQLQDTADRIPPRLAELEANQAAAQADLDQADANAKRAVVRAPFAGVLQSVDVEEGESITAGSRVARVVQLSRIEVPIRIPASARNAFKVGDAVTLTVQRPAGPARFDATLRRIAPEFDADTRTATVYAELNQAPPTATQPGDDALLYPGSFVSASIDTPADRPRTVLPRQAVQDQRVLTVAGDRVKSVPVDIAWFYQGQLPQLGLPGQTQWVVLDQPLPPGTAVILTGSIKVLDGMKVIIEPSPQRPSPQATP